MEGFVYGDGMLSSGDSQFVVILLASSVAAIVGTIVDVVAEEGQRFALA